ncbi:hypothetical protein GS421_03100 [Rhodococcus hoagii]|nr:hypothetical protein [Prescottella equi]
MPQADDFETFFDDADNETDTDSTAVVDATPTPSGAGPNRAARRGGKKGRKKPVAIPEGAPVPQDHLAKKDPRAAEADGGATIVLRCGTRPFTSPRWTCSNRGTSRWAPCRAIH